MSIPWAIKPAAKINIATPQRDRAFLYILTEIFPRVLSKIYAMKVLTNIIETKNDRAYATGANGSSFAAVAIKGPPIRNQNTYTFGFNRFGSSPL